MSEMSEKQVVLMQILYENDPMGTCCKENECDDEYYYAAEAIIDAVLNGFAVTRAVRDQLVMEFGADPMEEDIEIIVAEIKAREVF